MLDKRQRKFLQVDVFTATPTRGNALAVVLLTNQANPELEGMNVKPISLASPPEGYAEWLADLKGRIYTAQQRASLAVNSELVLLYWQIVRDISVRQAD